MLTNLSLFSGIGGLDLAAEWAGFSTVGQCEWADYPYAILEKHWPDVPKWRDIRSLTKESFYAKTGLHTVTIVSGGFPCQPFSIAGKRRGDQDDRYLWPEMFRVITELRPRWVLGENVTGIINMALDQALFDLESIGYSTGAVVIPACAANAPHRRDRIAILAANPHSFGHTRHERLPEDRRTAEKWGKGAFGPTSQLFDDADWTERVRQSAFLRNDYGIPHRLDRIRCLGNAAVPAQFYPIFRGISQLEEEKTCENQRQTTSRRKT